MRTTIRSISRSSPAKNHRSRRFIARHLTLWLALLILGTAVVLSSVLAGARDESLKLAAPAGQKQRTPVADVLNENHRVKLEGSGNSDVSSADRERLEADLFVNSPSPPERRALTPTSSASPRATPNNDNGQPDPGGLQEGNLQNNDQTVQARAEGDKVSRKPKEERLTKAHPLHED